MAKAETATQKKRLLEKARRKYREKRDAETSSQRKIRLEKQRKADERRRHRGTSGQQEARLKQKRQSAKQKRLQINESNQFDAAINVFADKICDVCTKRCYPKQVAHFKVPEQAPEYLPAELIRKSDLVVCHRCKSHLTKMKSTLPPKAYWNDLDPGTIPPQIAALSEAEQRLLARINPFMKIVKFSGLYGQYGLKGQAILFAQDIFEVTAKLPTLLPRSTSDADIVVVTESLQNIDIRRNYSVSKSNLISALQWLKENNPLYKDVVIDFNNHLDEGDIIRIVTDTIPEGDKRDTREFVEVVSAYVPLNNQSRILHASWHQGNTDVFNVANAGRQCFIMALAAIIRSLITNINDWKRNTVNENMLAADTLYGDIKALLAHTENPIPANGYMTANDIYVVKDKLNIFGRNFKLQYDEEAEIYGSLQDRANKNNIGYTLKNGFAKLFENHAAGIIIANSQSFAIIKHEDKYYLFNSHSCGPKGSTASNGKACVIECDNMPEFHRICRRATGSRNVYYTINYIIVEEISNGTSSASIEHMNEVDNRGTSQHVQMNENPQCTSIISVRTSMMGPVNCVQPDVEEELEVSNVLNEIVRKTKDNIVNENHELKAEEFAWYHLLPYGKNGLKEKRVVKISPLDYYQFRLLGNDLRFQRNDYLFYALSMFEYYRVKSTISACGRKIQGQDGMVSDVHLYLRNLRGSAAYWHTSLNELIAMIRCLGPPHFFITLSCNDIWWIDMRKAMLIADGKPELDPETLSVQETQLLVEKYPVVVSREFMIRVEALMSLLKKNDQFFGSKLHDFWWRVEFQNRGSPHLHMVIWLETCPAFDTVEGLELIDKTCSCKRPSESEDAELSKLVEKCQTHHHTATCKKNTTLYCRFGFPRQECDETKVVAHSSEEFVRSNGRIVILKRRVEDKWINNYHPDLLRLWKGNMDIQPCGTNEAIAYYVAKYISKSEPTGMDPDVARAIREIRREESDLSMKLFKICMRILKERQISACECAFRLCHLKMRDGSRCCIFLNTRKPEQRYKVLKFNENGSAEGFYSNIFERYEKRPLEHREYDFDRMPLIEFAMLFEPHYHSKQLTEEDVNVDEDAYELNENDNSQMITLTDLSKMRKRNKPATIRVPYFKSSSDPENFYYSLLLQYLPFRKECDLLNGFNSAKDAFLSREEDLKRNSVHMEIYRTRDKQLENAFIQVHAFEVLDTYEPIEDDDEMDIPVDYQIDEADFHETRNAMNVEQRSLYNRITRSIQDQLEGSTDRDYIFVTGGAGTGKTFTLNVLRNQINRCYGNKPSVRVCALTGVAARLVEGTTLHRALKLPVQKDGRIGQMLQLTGNFLRIMRQQWQDIKYLFIDEISMVPYEMLCMIESRTRQLKNNEELFGGLNLLVFGDPCQLPPVRGHQVFEQPQHMYPALHLWRCFSLCELKDNMRQKGDNLFIDILNALRVGELCAEHFNVLLQKVFEPSGEFSIEKALRIYPTNKQVSDHNDKVLKFYEERNTAMFTIKAQDQIVDSMRNIDNVTMDSIIPTDINKTGGLPKELKIFKGAKVMLRSNIDVSKGLVNGAIGFIEEILWPCFRRAQMYKEDIPSVKIKFEKIGDHVVKPISIQFPAKKSYGTAERRMLPLILSWASTVHKMQGSTVDYAVVYLGSKLFAAGQAYVALSRVRSLDGLCIEELDCEKLIGNKPCNVTALEELERLRSLNSN